MWSQEKRATLSYIYTLMIKHVSVFKFQIIIEPVRFASILSSFKIKQFASLIWFLEITTYVRFASLDSQFSIKLLRFASIVNRTIERVCFASKIIFLLSKVFASLRYRRKHHYRSLCLLFVFISLSLLLLFRMFISNFNNI